MNTSLISLSDADLLSRLRNFENNFVERKTSGDHRDWLKTVVGFANSTPVGYPAVLFIGVRNDGTPETGINLDSLQQTFTRKMQEAYPPIYFVTRVLGSTDSQFLAIVVPGSEDRPHFAGPSYVRRGSATEIASESQFNELIAHRLSKNAHILKWRGKPVSIDRMRTGSREIAMLGPVETSYEQTIADCNAFYVTFGDGQSIPLRRVEVSFDSSRKRLKLEIYPT